MGDGSFGRLPNSIKNKGAITNPQNKDDELCFKWAVTISFFASEKRNAGRITNQLVEDSKKFNWEGITFPMALKDIDKFERQNPDFAVYVFGYESEVYPLRRSENGKATKEIKLFLYNGHFS